MFLCIPRWLSAIPYLFFIISCAFCFSQAMEDEDGPKSQPNESPIYIWPLPAEFTFGDKVLSVNPGLSLPAAGYGRSRLVRAAFDRYRKIIFKNIVGRSTGYRRKLREVVYDINKVKITVRSNSDKLQLGVDESYTLLVSQAVGQSCHGNVTIEANTIYGAVRALETFSQLCSFNYTSKTVQIHNAPWSIRDKPRFAYRGLLLDTSRHYFPIDVIKQIIESMAYAKLISSHFLLRCQRIQNYGMVLILSGSVTQ